MYNIYIREDEKDEQVANELSYGEVLQYLIDCYREIKTEEELKDIEEGLYKDEKFIKSLIDTETYLDFDNYKLKIKEVN